MGRINNVISLKHGCTSASHQEEGVISNLHSGICKELTSQPSRVLVRIKGIFIPQEIIQLVLRVK